LKRLIFLILSLIILEGCSNFSNNSSNNLVARAGENFLYENDLPVYTSKDDSLIKISSFIETWAKEKVLFDLSMINLSQSKKAEIDVLVENYKVDLYINSYKDLIVNSRIDSIVTIEQIDSFYYMNINNFKLNENLVKYRYIKVPYDNININRIRRSIVRINEQDRYFLDSLNFQFADLKLNDSTWFTERDVISSIDFINQNNKSKYFIKNRLFTIEESNYTNFFIVDDILRSGNIPPISYLYERIKSTVVNQRKLNLLKNLNKEILNDALKSRKYEVYK
jgi:adenine/guanine phosphoribosyltransferase-like PRPP-binding protein